MIIPNEAPEHPIPVAALDEDIAILGRKGGGKSYTAKGIVERLLDMGRRVLVLDPLGVWAGLRTSANGERAGYPIAIFGGLHGDLPLDPAAAEPLARIIAAENLPAVIDLSELSKTAQQAFLLKFLHELRRANHDALTVVLEEADVFSPQQPQGDDNKALHAEIDWIARRGRFKGFRLLTITQRPARLSKDVLTQANMLIMHRLPSPQDQGAGLDWIASNGDLGKAKLVKDSLGSLKVGEAWVLAQQPHMLERATFPRIKTLDTSATPKAGETRIVPKTLADVDVSAIRDALKPKSTSKPVEKIIAPDPKALAAEFERGRQEGYAAGVKDEANRLCKLVLDFSAQFVLAVDTPPAAPAKAVPSRPATVLSPAPKQPPAASVGDLTVPQGRIVRSLSMWAALGHDAPTKIMVAAIAGYRPGSGNYNNLLGQLRAAGVVDYPSPGAVRLIANTSPMTATEGRDALLSILTGPQRKLFDALFNGEMSKAELAEATGYSAGSGNFNSLVGQLRSIGIADYPAPGRVSLNAWVLEVMNA